MSEVSLSASVRSNLLTLKSTADQLETTTERLSSGKKVASAIDNPTNYFAAENYNDKADALDSRLDGMSEATEMINAADNGITNIKAFLSQMEGVVNDALSNTDADERDALGEQFNELLTQIRDMAQDSGYGGVNLLYDNASTTVQFGENIGDSTLDLDGFNISAAAGDVNSTTGEIDSAAGYIDANGSFITSTAYAATIATAGEAAVSAGATAATGEGSEAYYAAMASYASMATAAGFTSSAMSAYDSASEYAAASAAVHTGASATDYSQSAYDYAEDAAGTNYSGYALTIDVGGVDSVGLKSAGTSGDDWEIDWGGDDYLDTLETIITQIEDMSSTLQTQSSKLANNLAVITQREDFTEEAINILEEGADNLTLADLNEEGANLLSLQTSESLAVQSLSLASDSASNVLNLIS